MAQPIYPSVQGDPEDFSGRCSKGRAPDHRFFLRTSLPYCRFGVIVPRQLGNVVRRNRAKRVFREILRTSLSQLVGGVDILVLPKGPLPVDDYQKVKAELLTCLERLGLLMNTHSERNPSPLGRG